MRYLISTEQMEIGGAGIDHGPEFRPHRSC